MHGAGTGANTIQAVAGPILTASVQRGGGKLCTRGGRPASLFRLGSGPRLTGAGGEPRPAPAGPCEKLTVTRQEALASRKAAGWVRRVLSAG